MADLNKQRIVAANAFERQQIELQSNPENIKAECRKIYVQGFFKPKDILPEVQVETDIKKLSIQWNSEYEKGKDDQGFINYEGIDLKREEFFAVKLNEQSKLSPA
jgi:hypothetical protein